MICWTPVVLDCNGGLEPAAVVYRHEVALLPPQGFISCVVENVVTTCPLPKPAAAFALELETDECAPTPEPYVGEIVMVRTTAIDAAGNEDCGL